MDMTLDTETHGLDATKPILWSIMHDEITKPITLHHKDLVKSYILIKALSCYKSKRVLNIYMHNAKYDTASFIDFEDPNMIYFSNDPLIWAYKVNGKEIIKYLDTFSIYRMSLAKIGAIIGHEKQDMPEYLQSATAQATPDRLKQIAKYCENDTLLTYKAVKYIKEKLKSEGIDIRRLYTINQIAINYILQKVKNIEHPYELKTFFENVKLNKVIPTRRHIQIHGAYRGGRVEAFKTGKLSKVTYVDCNSLYPYSLANIRFPDISSERMVYEPLKSFNLYYLLSQIGVSRVLMKNVSNHLGLLQIRTTESNYIPKPGQTFIGTYTHDEILDALATGYCLVGVQWSVIYQETYNIFKKTVEDTYNRRMTSMSPFDMYFYKSMMNSAIGKMAQTRAYNKITVDSVEKLEEYKKRNYEVVRGYTTSYFYQSLTPNTRKKPYYCPIIPTLVNAYARCYMHRIMQNIPLSDLVYTDTDSVIFTGEHINMFPINNELGSFKIEQQDTDAMIFGRKTRRIGSDIKIAGLHTKGITSKQFDDGYVEGSEMITINTAENIKDIGKFKTLSRDLNVQMFEYNNWRNNLESVTEPLIDADINDILFFIPYLNK